MIPPLHQDLAQLHQWEMRQEAARRRLVRPTRQADRATPALRGLPQRDGKHLRTLGWLALRIGAAVFGPRAAMKATDR